jgi:hypothetical protein
MSTTENTSNTVIWATLSRGRVYFYNGKEFHFEVPQIVTQAEHDYLKDNAVDQVTVEDEGEHQNRSKFTFTTGPVGEAAPVVSPPPRARRRGC